ncbi:putative porin [Arenibacter sp. GZD96]|uniref:putative porin n=1 Tax=Aurantibrevibacter litoralis TaxID=3106030 RepID=UPI002AFFBC9D|nr:putative porin [Arenibacter sp. GZD-96]MEA1787334.1 putative porin [Arenibacter sp. GZD-96]
MKYLIIILFVFVGSTLFAQEDSIPPVSKTDTLLKKKIPQKKIPQKNDSIREITVENYKIISFKRDTTFLDSSLTIQKEYKYNYLRKDDFELMPFANVGQPYNKLGVTLTRSQSYPTIGARAKHLNYMEIEDIDYYNVATPLTELMFKTTFEQGQLLDAWLTFNTSPRLNFSIAYKGFRSLGKFQHSQSESGNFRTTTNYLSKNGRYALRGHIVVNDIENQENGGLANKEVQFESGDPEFRDRTRLDVVFSNADNRVLGKRYYAEHTYRVLGKDRDSLNKQATAFRIGHRFNFETKFYQFKQSAANPFFGSAFLNSINDKATLKTTYNQFQGEFVNPILGKLTGLISIYSYDYFFDSILVTDTEQIQNQLQGEEIAIGGNYEKRIGGFQLKGNLSYTVSGELTGNTFDATASYNLNAHNRVRFGIYSSSNMPDFNFLLYQSDYQNYNWQNNRSFYKERVNGLEFNFESMRWGTLNANYTTVDNYSYFKSEATQEQVANGQENAFVKPFQSSGINYLKVKYEKEFKWGMFALNNTVMYQNVSQSSNVLNVPELVTRNTLYFSSDVFKRAMYLQTGITFKYFSEYNMDAYNPLLGEFYVQENEKLGGFPMLDFFINARVKQTRIFLKAEHFNSSFTGFNFYSAPNYPYRDFVIRFGLVWNFFS